MTREEAVQVLVRFDQPVDVLRASLTAFNWDWVGPPLARLTCQAVESALHRYQRGELTGDEVEAWADLLEGRDDIEFEPMAAQAIFELANPELHGPLPDIVPALLARL